MAKYYYKRYTAKIQYSLDSLTMTKTTGLVFDMAGDCAGPYSQSVAKSKILCDPDTGLYFSSNIAASAMSWSAGDYYLYGPVSPTCIYAAVAWANNGTTIKRLNQALQKSSDQYTFTIEPYYIAGNYVGEVVAEDGTYPDNGKSGDYWYVKDRIAIRFYTRIGGAWTETAPYVRVNGVWKPADIKPRANGAWIG